MVEEGEGCHFLHYNRQHFQNTVTYFHYGKKEFTKTSSLFKGMKIVVHKTEKERKKEMRF